MSQKQPQYQTGSQVGQQSGSQGAGSQQWSGQQWTGQGGGQQWSGQGGGGQFQGRLSQQQRSALMQVAEAVEVCGWCADRCIQHADPNMIECIRLCEDVVELGETTLALLPRNSRHGQSVLQTFQQAAQACAQECGRHEHAHCQECARVLQQVASATQQLTQSTGQQFA